MSNNINTVLSIEARNRLDLAAYESYIRKRLTHANSNDIKRLLGFKAGADMANERHYFWWVVLREVSMPLAESDRDFADYRDFEESYARKHPRFEMDSEADYAQWFFDLKYRGRGRLRDRGNEVVYAREDNTPMLAVTRMAKERAGVVRQDIVRTNADQMSDVQALFRSTVLDCMDPCVEPIKGFNSLIVVGEDLITEMMQTICAVASADVTKTTRARKAYQQVSGEFSNLLQALDKEMLVATLSEAQMSLHSATVENLGKIRLARSRPADCEEKAPAVVTATWEHPPFVELEQATILLIGRMSVSGTAAQKHTIEQFKENFNAYRRTVESLRAQAGDFSIVRKALDADVRAHEAKLPNEVNRMSGGGQSTVI